MRRRTRVVAVFVAAGVLSLVAAPAATAAEGDVDVVNTETVQVYLSPDGEVESRRVYEQLTLTGTGSVELTNPVETKGLRNLAGFGGFEVRDGQQVVEGAVDGTEQLRTVSDYTGDLPVTVTPTYRLDGKVVEPGDLVGRSGRLEVTFAVTNRTSREQQVTVTDGAGNEVTRTVQVPVPLVGSLATTLPPAFTRVEPNGASAAGDGKGGTRLSYTMTLFPPLGSDTAELTYAATVQNAVVPQAEVTLLPINPFANPTVKKAADSYDSGAATGAQLVAGAGEIDTNLLRLRDGAAELLAGLVKLSDGAAELRTGLAGKAAPGSKQLADGAARLAGGTGAAAAGSRTLHEGLGQISGGLTALADGLPAAPAGVAALVAGVDQIRAGLGDPARSGTLLNGLSRLGAGAGQLRGGLAVLRGDGSADAPGLVGAQGGVDEVQSGLADATRPGGSLDQLIGGLSLLKGMCAPCVPVIDQLVAGAEDSKRDLTAANLGLLQVSAGLGRALTALDPANGEGLAAGAARLEAGLADALSGATKLAGGTDQVRAGLVQLEGKLTEAVAGVLKLEDGAGTAHEGSSDLASGLDELDAGAGRVSDGARDLAAGLGDAATGSGLLADGLTTAAGGAPRLVDGAGRLSQEGMGALTEAGTETAVEYGTLSATIGAAAVRAEESGMAYGAPEGAQGLTAYSLVLKGADGESARNWTRGLGAVVLLGMGGLFAVRRRLV